LFLDGRPAPSPEPAFASSQRRTLGIAEENADQGAAGERSEADPVLPSVLTLPMMALGFKDSRHTAGTTSSVCRIHDRITASTGINQGMVNR
jgi:hypothetical protein